MTFGLTLAALVLCIAVSEILVETWFYLGRSGRNAQVAPSYPTSFHTASGDRISHTDGYLKLALHPFLGYRNLPNQSNPHFTINSRGFRGREVSVVPVKRRLVLVGGSTAFGTGLNRDEDTFAAQVEEVLPGSEVVNAAVVGHQSGQEFVYLVTELLDLKPDVIIALDGWNDYYQAFEWNDPPLGVSGFDQIELELRRLHQATAFESLRSRMVSLGGILLPELRRLTRSALDANLPHLAARLLSRTPESSQQMPGGMPPVPPEVERRLERVILAYERNVLKMAEVSRMAGGQFLCVIQPIRYSFQSSPPRGVRPVRYPKFRNHVAATLQVAKVPYVDLNEAQDVLKASMFLDDVHLDAEGNAVMARLVAKAIRAKLQERPR
jgi:lysophospholipase L1-like esterase